MLIRETVYALAACVISFVLCAIAYPTAVWGLGQLLFPVQAEGSLIFGRDRAVIGSELIAQPFASDGYFQPRPSAAGATGYAADAASGSNLGTKNPALRQRISLDAARQVQRHTGDPGLRSLLDLLDAQQADLKAKNEIAEKSKSDTEAIATLEGQVAATQAQVVETSMKLARERDGLVPPDLVTTSGGGLDPHISPESAHYQAGRVASARGLKAEQVRSLIDLHTERSGAIVGAPPRVNVLTLNRALDEAKPAPGPTVPPGEEKTLAPADPVEPATGPKADAAGPDPASGLATLRRQIEALSGQIEQIGGKVQVSRDDGTVAGLKDLEARVARISEDVHRAATLVEHVGRIDEDVKQAGATLQQLRSELGETRKLLERPGAIQPVPGRRP